MKNNFVNFLNMAFDNAKDPKLELIGINEHTVFMYAVALFGDKSLDIKSDEAIQKHIEKVSKYFNSQLVKDFTMLMRRVNGGMKDGNVKSVGESLKNKYPENEVDSLISFYYKAREIGELRRFYSMTQEMPISVVELQTDTQLYNKIRDNKLNFFNTKNLFQDGHPIVEFAIAERALAISRDLVFADSFEYSRTAREIYKVIYDRLKASNVKYVTKEFLTSISRGLNQAAAIRATGIRQTLIGVEKQLIDNLQKYRELYPDNKFLQSISVATVKGRPQVQITADYQRTKIPDGKLDQIRSDFDAIYAANPKLANELVFYTLSKWGTSTSPWRGSYYNLIEITIA
jgi:hypothetical protein